MGPVLAKLGLIDGKRTDTGELGCAVGNVLGAFGVEKVEDIPDTADGRLACQYLEWKYMGKLQATYVDGIRGREKDKKRKAVASKLDSNSRLHARFNQCVTNTNRLSSSDPNVQNIPARPKPGFSPEVLHIGMAIRKAFVASPGHVLVGGDFSQLQLRVWAEFTADPVFVQAYNQTGEKSDFHQYAASALGQPRSTIKNFVFAVLFGADEAKAARTAGLEGAIVAPFIQQMQRDIPSLSTFKIAVGDSLAARGYVESLMGWRGFFPDFWSPVRQWQAAALREATNFPIQATEAGLVKACMIAIHSNLRRYYNNAPKLVLQVHDELWADCPTYMSYDVAQMMKETCEEVSREWFKLVPIKFETKIVQNWAAGK